MNILNSNRSDRDEIFRLYQAAASYQKTKKTVVVWPEFDRSLVETEIDENRQWKLLVDGRIACVWATTFSDEQIWEERNKDRAIYIHRIATHPDFRGNNFVAVIVGWAKDYARAGQLDFVRLDTLGNNTRLIEHYTGAGFRFLGMFNMKNTAGLPSHYHGTPVCLFEIDVRS